MAEVSLCRVLNAHPWSVNVGVLAEGVIGVVLFRLQVLFVVAVLVKCLVLRLPSVVTSEWTWTCVVFRPDILLTPSMAQTPLSVLRTLRIRLAARVLRL